jgi:hypothetical protein
MSVVMKKKISAIRLMEASESCIETVYRHGSPGEQQFVERLFDNPTTYSRWESEHFRLMRFVAEDPHPASELYRLRRTCFALTHRKALFEYLRNNRVTGADRIAVFRAIYGSVDYSRAVVAEHGRFLLATWSRLCSDHVGAALLNDAAFVGSLPGYEIAYSDYLALYCGRVIAENRGEEYSQESLVGYTKDAAAEMRTKLLTLAPRPAVVQVATPAKNPRAAGAMPQMLGHALAFQRPVTLALAR